MAGVAERRSEVQCRSTEETPRGEVDRLFCSLAISVFRIFHFIEFVLNF